MSSNSCLWILKSLLKLHLTRILFSKFPSPLEKLVSILTPCNYSSIPSPIAEIPYPRVTFVNEIAFIAGIPQERIPPRFLKNLFIALSFRFSPSIRSNQIDTRDHVSVHVSYPHTQTHEIGQLVIIPTIISTSTTISIYHQAGINCPINTPDPAALLGRKVGAAIIKSNYQKNNAIQ